MSWLSKTIRRNQKTIKKLLTPATLALGAATGGLSFGVTGIAGKLLGAGLMSGVKGVVSKATEKKKPTVTEQITGFFGVGQAGSVSTTTATAGTGIIPIIIIGVVIIGAVFLFKKRG